MALTSNQLLPGDILLYRGDHIIFKAIRFFDGTPVNHAGLYVGDGNVNEALGGDLARRSLAESAQGNKLWVRRLKMPAPTMNPVLEVAGGYMQVGVKYGYSEIVLLLFLALTRKLTPVWPFSEIVRTLLDQAAAVLDTIATAGQKHMICSEFVYRCYDETDPSQIDLYTLHIPGFSYQELLQAMFPQAPQFKTFSAGLDFLTSPQVVGKVVTPGDLYHCDNLNTVLEDA